MQAVLALIAAVSSSASAAEAPAADERGISLSHSGAPRAASLLEGLALDSSHRPSEWKPLRLADPIRFAAQGAPAPLDDGGGVSSDVRQILALILGFIPGFGIGHLVARDRDGFILFLIVDIALYTAGIVLGIALKGVFWGIGGLIWVVVHVIQALDAYAEAGGERIVQRTRDLAVAITAPPGRDGPVTTSRTFAFHF